MPTIASERLLEREKCARLVFVMAKMATGHLEGSANVIGGRPEALPMHPPAQKSWQTG
jgi:hypothetical protein